MQNVEHILRNFSHTTSVTMNVIGTCEIRQAPLGGLSEDRLMQSACAGVEAGRDEYEF